jgi:DNA ligase-associated metallophosphoesterase
MRRRPDEAVDAAAEFTVAGTRLTVLPSGAAFWAAESTLIVTDLHLETGSSFARRGALVPPFDTGTTLARLADDVLRLSPERVISLGDAFHDGDGPRRMDAATREALARLIVGRRWIWIAGNHDGDVDTDLDGERAEEIALGPLTFRHHPAHGERAAGEIAGHLHPAARIRVGSGTVRRHCFVGDGRRAILPAYGAYAGGLDIASPAFAGLFEIDDLVVGVIGAGTVHRFPAGSIAGLAVSPGGTGRHRANR